MPAVGVLLEDREGEAVEPGDVRPQDPLPDPRVVLAERHVEGPMARVLHRPVASHRPGEQLHAHRQAAEVVADLDALLLALPPQRRHHADRFQPLPLGLAGQALGGRQLQVGPLLLAAVPAIGRRQFLGPLQVPFQLLVDVLDDRRVQRLVVPLQGQDVVGLAADHLPRRSPSGPPSRRS